MKINLYGIIFELLSDNHIITKKIEEFFAPFITNIPTAHHSIDIKKNQLLLNNKCIQCHSSTYDSFLARQNILITIKNILYQEVKNYLFIHGGVAEKNGIVFIFTGDSGVGKSTMIASLLLHDWHILGDHVVPLFLRNERIDSFPIPLELWNPPTGLIQKLQKKPSITLDGCVTSDGKSYYYVDWDRRIENIDLHPCTIFFINRAVNVPALTHFKNISKRDMLTMLIPQCTNLFHQNKDAYSFLLKTVLDIPSKEVVYHGIEGLEEVVNMLEKIS